ncbi:hypothetical protein Q9L58_009541 [Maublancomyces gigas]|uniref:Uncharacterized protein n=1 Tax=Discina gigas TaxID=1032678 RepID=A0ABR3G6Z6_9PEZI
MIFTLSAAPSLTDRSPILFHLWDRPRVTVQTLQAHLNLDNALGIYCSSKKRNVRPVCMTHGTHSRASARTQHTRDRAGPGRVATRKTRRKDERLKMKKQIKKLEEQNKKSEKAVEQIFRAAVEDRQMVEQKLEEQNVVMRQYEEDLNRSNLLHQTTNRIRQPPVEPRPGKDHRSILLSHQDRFTMFGFHSEVEMETFANTAIDSRNSAAQKILERGFKLIFGLNTVGVGPRKSRSRSRYRPKGTEEVLLPARGGWGLKCDPR